MESCPVKKVKIDSPLMILCRPQPVDEAWSYPCPHCGKTVKAKLVFDINACEYQITVEEEK